MCLGVLMKKAIFAIIFPLSGCAQPYYHTLSVSEQIAKGCREAGYQDKEFNDCVKAAGDSYKKESEKRKRELSTAQKQQEKIQADKDKAKCREYGLKYGTKEFAGCMMNIEAARNNDVVKQKLIDEQAQLQQERRESLRNSIQNANQWNSLANPSNGFINTSPLATFMAAKSRADAASQLIDNGYDTNDVNAILPQTPPKPRQIDCNRFEDSISCTERY